MHLFVIPHKSHCTLLYRFRLLKEMTGSEYYILITHPRHLTGSKQLKLGYTLPADDVRYGLHLVGRISRLVSQSCSSRATSSCPIQSMHLGHSERLAMGCPCGRYPASILIPSLICFSGPLMAYVRRRECELVLHYVDHQH